MPSPTINKTGRSVANTLQLLAIALSCCCLLVNGQQQQQQQQHLKYQQLQYQMQQQYEYQQQQHYQQQFQQQQQQQQQLTPTAALVQQQQQQQHEEQIDLLSTQPTQVSDNHRQAITIYNNYYGYTAKNHLIEAIWLKYLHYEKSFYI
ncbi:hypothetical protein KR059_002528 [Drosophila kikkawai]|nr:hypothetical protein KR059_002528 [Drosophila kikkawai]